MLNYLLCHKDSITFLIAIVSFILSVGQFVFLIYGKIVRLSVNIQNIEFANHATNNDNVILLCITNNSTTPIAITRIVLITSRYKYPCRINHHYIGERYYPDFPNTDLPRTERFFSSDLPIQLTGTQCFSGFICFETKKSDAIIDKGNQIKLKIITNKGEKTFMLKCPENNTSSMNL